MSTLATQLIENPNLKLSVRHDGRLQGTFSIDEFLACVERGEFLADDEVRSENLDGGTTVAEIHPAVLVAASRARQRSLPRRRGILTNLGAIVPAAGLGCLGAGTGGGAGLVALVVLGLYIWGTIDMNRGGAIEQQTAALRDKIVRHVAAHPDFTTTSGDALFQVPGVLDDDDRELIDDEKLVLHPIDARSAADALVIVRPQRSGQRMYYKDGRNDYIIKWGSPDGRYELVNEPQVPLGSGRLLRLVDQSGRDLLAHRTAATTVSAVWRADGRAIALNETSPRKLRLTVLQLRPDGGARIIPGGSDLEPAAMLPSELQSLRQRWLSDSVSSQRWLESGALRVERFFNVTVLDADDQPRQHVTARQQLDVAVDDNGALRVIALEPAQYHHSTPNRAE